MSVIAEFSIPADQFTLGQLLEVRPGVTVRLESVIPTGDAVIPYLWVRRTDAEAVEAALDESPLVDEVEVVDEVEEEALLRVRWSEGVDGFIGAMRDSDAVVLDGEGHGDDWTFRFRFLDQDSLSAFYRDLVDTGVRVRLAAVHNPGVSPEAPEFELTPTQREALSIALERGYFAVPREITLVELAEELGISDSAVSQRIRRGITTILSSTIATSRADDSE